MASAAVLFSLVIVLKAYAVFSDDIYPLVQIEPKADTGTRNVQYGKSYTLTCSFKVSEDDPVSQPDVILWTYSGKEIGSDRFQSLFTHQISKDGRKSTILFIKNSTATESSYTCKVLWNNEYYEKVATVHVYAPPRWSNHETEVVGTIGEPANIDCTADPTVPGALMETVMGFANRTDLPSRYEKNKESNRVKISKLTMADRGAIVQCEATQFYQLQQQTATAIKNITLNVYFHPVFSPPNITRYGIIEHDVVLPCQVADANPPVGTFHFYVGGTDNAIESDSKYQVAIDLVHQNASLTIRNLTDQDYESQYTCVATSRASHLHSELKIDLVRGTKPTMPQLHPMKVKSKEIIFSVIPVPAPDKRLDVTFFKFSRILSVDKQQASNPSVSNRWRHAVYNKSSDDTYTVSDLMADTSYWFEIRAGNEAGLSQPLAFNVSTLKLGADSGVTGDNGAYDWRPVPASTAMCVLMALLSQCISSSVYWW